MDGFPILEEVQGARWKTFPDISVARAVEFRDRRILHAQSLHGNIYCGVQMDINSKGEWSDKVALGLFD